MPTIPHPASTSQEGAAPGSVADRRKVASSAAVGESRIAMSESADALSDEAREAAIKHAGNLVVKFANAGKRVNAMHALTMMHALIAGRSPEWIAKRTAQIQQAIAASPGGEGCYFIDAGNADREALASNEQKAQG